MNSNGVKHAEICETSGEKSESLDEAQNSDKNLTVSPKSPNSSKFPIFTPLEAHERDEEHDFFHEDQLSNMARSNPRSPEISDNISEANSDMFVRPHSQRGRYISTRCVVTPNKSHSTGDLQGYYKSNPKRPLSRTNSKDNMVLQLVLPSGNNNSNHPDNNNYLTATSIDDILGNNHLKERSHKTSVSSSQGFYSLQNYNGPSYTNQGYSDLEDKQPNGFKRMDSVATRTTTHSTYSTDKPTSQEDKNKAFKNLLTGVLSGFYALFNITLGLAVYVTDVIDTGDEDDEPLPLAENFSLYLVVTAFAYLAYLTIDITIYMRKKAKYVQMMEKNTSDEIEMKETPDGHYELSIPLPEAATLGKSLEHHYCLNKDRHSANFYLKVGAAAFCFGHLIHSGLLLGYRIWFMTNNFNKYYECSDVATMVLDFIYPVYSFLLLYFIFKYSNVIINRHEAIARFGIMHCLSASLCFWIWTIFRETVEYLSNSEYDKEYTKSTPKNVQEVNFDNSQPFALPLTSYSQKGAQILTQYVNVSVRRFTKICDTDEDISIIYRNYSPYLYPFSVEYSILVVGVLFIVWQNIGICKPQNNAHEDLTASTRQCSSATKNAEESNIVIHADCHAANKGLFGGFVLLVFSVVSIILFFISIYNENSSSTENGFIINAITSLTILSIMLICSLLAYRQITTLDVNTAHHNLLDDLLLFVCIPAFFLNGIFSIIPAIIYRNGLASASIFLEIVQVLVQTPFILDGLRRSSDTKDLRKKKPGRELVTFLVIANLAMWLLQTFEVKSHGLLDYRYEFYSKELWTIIGHMCLPLMMFYRYHASVCLGDIWKYAYEPSGH